MALIKWNRKNDPFTDFFGDWDQPLFGTSLLPQFDKTLASVRDFYPAVDVSEDGNSIIVNADVPGLKKEDIQLSIENNVLTIRGERKHEEEKKEKNFHRVERSYGIFERRIDLGASVDEAKADASYQDGVLKIVLPKGEDRKRKSIAIK